MKRKLTLKIGQRIKVKTGNNHAGFQKGNVGYIRAVLPYGYAVCFDATPGVFDFTPDEVERLTDSSAASVSSAVK